MCVLYFMSKVKITFYLHFNYKCQDNSNFNLKINNKKYIIIQKTKYVIYLSLFLKVVVLLLILNIYFKNESYKKS